MKVYLVGAGPGDPELITLKGWRILKSADVVLYDSLIALELLEYAREGAELIHAGKRAGSHSIRQEEINELLIIKAREGKIIVRLKGGDPFVFGRGGEEASALFEAGIPFQIIPGITAATGIGAYCGIPLTDRRYSSEVLFMSACHTDLEPGRHDWAALAEFSGTIVIYMGTRHLQWIADKLLKNGMSPEMPISVTQDGTKATQKTITATLSTIAEEAEKGEIAPPALIIIGKVNNLRETLSWMPAAEIDAG